MGGLALWELAILSLPTPIGLARAIVISQFSTMCSVVLIADGAGAVTTLLLLYVAALRMQLLSQHVHPVPVLVFVSSVLQIISIAAHAIAVSFFSCVEVTAAVASARTRRKGRLRNRNGGSSRGVLTLGLGGRSSTTEQQRRESQTDVPLFSVYAATPHREQYCIGFTPPSSSMSDGGGALDLAELGGDGDEVVELWLTRSASQSGSEDGGAVSSPRGQPTASSSSSSSSLERSALQPPPRAQPRRSADMAVTTATTATATRGDRPARMLHEVGAGGGPAVEALHLRGKISSLEEQIRVLRHTLTEVDTPAE